jgi:DNA-binding MarR family transcriptional regulator
MTDPPSDPTACDPTAPAPSSEAQRFVELYAAIHDRFYRRVRPTAYRPSLESLALMRHLASTGPITIGEAAEHFSRSQAATSEIVSRLEDRDMVERVRDRRDRRRTLVWLSAAGQDAVRQAASVLSTRMLDEAFQQMTDEQRGTLLAGMQALIDTEKSTEGWEQ